MTKSWMGKGEEREKQRKCLLSPEARDKFILAWGLLLRSVEIKGGRMGSDERGSVPSLFHLWTLGITGGYCTEKLIYQEDKFSSIVQAPCERTRKMLEV